MAGFDAGKFADGLTVIYFALGVVAFAFVLAAFVHPRHRSVPRSMDFTPDCILIDLAGGRNGGLLRDDALPGVAPNPGADAGAHCPRGTNRRRHLQAAALADLVGNPARRRFRNLLCDGRRGLCPPRTGRGESSGGLHPRVRSAGDDLVCRPLGISVRGRAARNESARAPGRSVLRRGDWLVVPDSSQNQQDFTPDPRMGPPVEVLTKRFAVNRSTRPEYYGGPWPMVTSRGTQLSATIYRIQETWSPGP